jgi:hypothetical protein
MEQDKLNDYYASKVLQAIQIACLAQTKALGLRGEPKAEAVPENIDEWARVIFPLLARPAFFLAKETF